MPSSITCASCGASIDNSTGENVPCAVCGSTKRNCTIAIEPLHINLSPFAFQWYAKDFYDGYKAYKQVNEPSRFSPARLTLLAQSVELAAKSLHVNHGKRDADLRKLGHSLMKACDPTILGLYGIVLTSDETTELQKISDLNEQKAFEYFWFGKSNPEMTGLMHAVTGRDGLPDENIVEGLLVKLLAPKLNT